jgi:plastocyanin
MRIYLRDTRIAVTSLTIALLTACGGDSGYGSGPGPGTTGDPTPVQAATVQALPSITFTPGTVNLLVGGTVTFNFGSVAHDAFFDNSPPGAPESITTPTANATVTRTFTTKGTYVFNCHVHPGMSGRVIVQ